MVQHSKDNSNDGITIRAATLADAAGVVAIYNHFVLETIVTFEEQPIDSAEMLRRMESVWQASLPWLVAEQDGAVLGYAYASKWKERIGYRFSVESSVYCAPNAVGRGLGTRLYGALLPLLRERGVHAVIGGIALPNEASIALHEKLGMRKVAHFEQTGFKFDRWIDVGYWQCVLTS
jgi:L-amino acid N-acyltransferase YncA